MKFSCVLSLLPFVFLRLAVHARPADRINATLSEREPLSLCGEGDAKGCLGGGPAQCVNGVLSGTDVPCKETVQKRQNGGKGGNRNATGNKNTGNRNGGAGNGGAGAGNGGDGGGNAGGDAKGNTGNNGNGNKNNGGDDAQTSLTLDPKVIADGFQKDGQQDPADGQVASITSSNNFINFCLTVNKPITNGKQVKTGSCNPAPMGVIAATSNMPSSKFQFPKNTDEIKANKDFTIKMAVSNLETGNFVNAAANYFAGPQQVNQAGTIVGHSHVVVEKIKSLDSIEVTDPKKFAFFKGLNAKAQGGVLTADVKGGLEKGVYRLASINSAANHQPVLVAVAQHGSLDDMVYFTVN